MEANNHQGIQMELSQESLVKELAESKQREAELRKDNKDLFVAVFRCKATEARVKTLEDALKLTVKELKRLRYLHLPMFEGKVGEPDNEVIKSAKQALAAKEPKAEGMPGICIHGLPMEISCVRCKAAKESK